MKLRKEKNPKKKQLMSAVVSVAEILKYLIGDPYLSVKEASAYSRLSPDKLDYHSRVVGDLPRIKLAGKVLYRKSWIDHFLESYIDVVPAFEPEDLADKILGKLKKKIENDSSTKNGNKG